MRLRDYDKYTPAELRQRAVVLAELKAKLLLPVNPGARDPDPAIAPVCQDNIGSQPAEVCAESQLESVDSGVTDMGVTVAELIEALCQMMAPFEALSLAQEAYWQEKITKEASLRILNRPRTGSAT